MLLDPRSGVAPAIGGSLVSGRLRSPRLSDINGNRHTGTLEALSWCPVVVFSSPVSSLGAVRTACFVACVRPRLNEVSAS